MDGHYLFDTLPLWVTYAGIVLIILASARCGIAFSRWRKGHFGIEEDAPINTIGGATLAFSAVILSSTSTVLGETLRSISSLCLISIRD